MNKQNLPVIVWTWGTSLLLFAAYWIIFIQPFFPNATGGLGHDYQGSLSEAVIGYIHFERGGGLTWPWFTPATCGGNMFIAGVANPYLNTQQWLTFLLDALNAARVNFILFAVIGYVGCYQLLRRAFSMDNAGAVLGAAIFLFNGFFAHRMIIGHTGFHSFMLAPVIAAFLLSGGDRLRMSLAAGLGFAYVTLASGIYTLLPVILAVSSLLLLHQLRDGASGWRPYRLLTIALAVAFLISLFKISLALSVTGNITRDQYPLPGIPSIITSLLLPLRLLFVSAPDWLAETRYLFTNYSWNIDRHELEFNIGWVTLLLVAWGGFRLTLTGRPAWSKGQRLAAIALAGILLTPVLLNYYHPVWNAFIKQIPVLKSFSMFIRMYAIYIPVLAVAAAMAFTALTRYRMAASTGLIILLVATVAMTDRDYYERQSYDPSMLVDYDRSFRAGVLEPPVISLITNVAAISYDGKPLRVRNETFVYGASNMNCHNDMFGYRLESFPGVGLLSPETPVSMLIDGHYNMKNPACYVFPEANDCRAGDHFREDQGENLSRFQSYEGLTFNTPVYQKLANLVSLLALIGALAVIGWRTIKGGGRD